MDELKFITCIIILLAGKKKMKEKPLHSSIYKEAALCQGRHKSHTVFFQNFLTLIFMLLIFHNCDWFQIIQLIVHVVCLPQSFIK